MTFLIGIITSRLAGPAATIVAAILLALCVGQCTRAAKAESNLHKMQSALEQTKANLATCRTNTGVLAGAIERQNGAVAALKAESDAKVAVSAKAASAARSVAESYRRAAGRILVAKPTEADACRSAERLIAEFVQ